MMPPAMLNAGMAWNEAVAVARLRQWARDNERLKAGRVPVYKNSGWAERRQNKFDSALVRRIDFDRVLDMLKDEDKLALIFHYRDGHTAAEIASLLGCSERKIGYLLPIARKNLACLLDRYNLL